MPQTCLNSLNSASKVRKMADGWSDPFVNLAAQDNTVDDVGDHLKRLPKKNQTCVQMRWDVFRCLQMCSVQTSYHVCQHAKSGYLIVTSKWDPRAWGIRQNATTSHVNLHKECLTSWPDKWQIHWRHASHLKHYQSPAFGTLDNVITSLQSA